MTVQELDELKLHILNNLSVREQEEVLDLIIQRLKYSNTSLTPATVATGNRNLLLLNTYFHS